MTTKLSYAKRHHAHAVQFLFFSLSRKRTLTRADTTACSIIEGITRWVQNTHAHKGAPLLPGDTTAFEPPLPPPRTCPPPHHCRLRRRANGWLDDTYRPSLYHGAALLPWPSRPAQLLAALRAAPYRRQTWRRHRPPSLPYRDARGMPIGMDVISPTSRLALSRGAYAGRGTQLNGDAC